MRQAMIGAIGLFWVLTGIVLDEERLDDEGGGPRTLGSIIARGSSVVSSTSSSMMNAAPGGPPQASPNSLPGASVASSVSISDAACDGLISTVGSRHGSTDVGLPPLCAAHDAIPTSSASNRNAHQATSLHELPLPPATRLDACIQGATTSSPPPSPPAHPPPTGGFNTPRPNTPLVPRSVSFADEDGRPSAKSPGRHLLAYVHTSSVPTEAEAWDVERTPERLLRRFKRCITVAHLAVAWSLWIQTYARPDDRTQLRPRLRVELSTGRART